MSGSSEIIIALMGVTGAGKSSLIRLLSGDSSVKVGHMLTSETTEIQEYRFRHRGRNYVLADTPGFDDTLRPNDAIVSDLLSWLASSFRAGTRLNGILYLHRVSDIRMTGSAFENLRMFRNLVGEAAFSNVILVTTFWDTVSLDLGQSREKELLTNRQFWGRMLEKGCQVRRMQDNTNRGEALKIIESVGVGKVTLQAQREIVEEGKNMRDTAAARETAKARVEFERTLAVERERARQELAQRELKEAQRIRAEKERIEREAKERRRKEEERRRDEEERERRRIEEERRRLVEAARRREAEFQERMARVRAEFEAEQRRAEGERARIRWEYYRNYRCIGKYVGKYRLCDRCKKNIHDRWRYFYREF
ncbi:P-loop containing nucleoside triphosphate hydrolase protein [Tirmania nivea]|nr:P-loop containing nucleoside triphosphate hydrolase protein [Tirmania nivea]